MSVTVIVFQAAGDGCADHTEEAAMSDKKPAKTTRRQFIARATRTAAIAGLGFATGMVYAGREDSEADGVVWQIDPHLCIACGKCATSCVLSPSAVKCMHTFAMCGYCDLCTGYFEPAPNALNTGAENQLCPVGAIKRKFVEHPYFEYQIDEELCFGCGRCVKGCTAFGNGSLFLQIKHDLCAQCNQCAIARDCPSGAVKRVSAADAYRLKGKDDES
jgi:electron transport complex protein RnfB